MRPKQSRQPFRHDRVHFVARGGKCRRGYVCKVVDPKTWVATLAVVLGPEDWALRGTLTVSYSDFGDVGSFHFDALCPMK